MSGVIKVRLLVAGLALGASGAAGAQDAPSSLPDLGNYSLPSSQPAPVPMVMPTPVAPVVVPPVPVPTPTPVPRAKPTPRATPAPTPTSTPTPRATPTVAASPTPVASPSPEAVPGQTPATTAAPDAGAATPIAPAPVPAERAPTAAARPAWLWPLLGGLVVLVLAGLFVWRRRRETLSEDLLVVPDTVETTPEPEAAPVEAPASVVATAPRFLDQAANAPLARIDLDEPSVSRAGLNMVTATADVTVTVRNASDVPARGIALDVRLTSAQPGQDEAIAAMFAGPVGRPATPPFDLAPGEMRRVRALATMPRDAITVLYAGGRPMFVPVVAIRAVHAGGQTTSVHALGIERPGQAKLGPFWLDQPSRMFDTIGVRPHSGRG